MRTMIASGLAFLATGVGCFRGQGSDVKIVGGAPVSGYQDVKMMLVDKVTLEICTGVVVSDSTVLLAGHCVKNGTLSLNIKAPDKTVDATAVYMWNRLIERKFLTGDDAARDLAVVVFPRGTFGGPYAQVTRQDGIAEGLDVDLVGYGATEFGRPLEVKPSGALGDKNLGSNVVQKVIDGVIYIEAELGPDRKPVGGRALAASGDSGSPMFIKGSHEVIGIGSAVGALDQGGRLLPLDDKTQDIAISRAARVRNLYVDLTHPISRRLMQLAVYHGADIPGVSALPGGKLQPEDLAWMVKSPDGEHGVGDYRGIAIPLLGALFGGGNGTFRPFGNVQVKTGGQPSTTSTVATNNSAAGRMGIFSLLGGLFRLTPQGATVPANPPRTTAGTKTAPSTSRSPSTVTSRSPSTSSSSSSSNSTGKRSASASSTAATSSSPQVAKPTVGDSQSATQAAQLTTEQQAAVKSFDQAVSTLTQDSAIAKTEQGKALADSATYCAGRLTGPCDPVVRWQNAQQACKVAGNWEACSEVNRQGESFAASAKTLSDAEKKALDQKVLETSQGNMTGDTLASLAKLDQNSGRWDPAPGSVEVPATKAVEASLSATETRAAAANPANFDQGYDAFSKGYADVPGTVADNRAKIYSTVEQDLPNGAMLDDPSFVQGMEKAKGDTQKAEAFWAGALGHEVNAAEMTQDQMSAYQDGAQVAQEQP